MNLFSNNQAPFLPSVEAQFSGREHSYWAQPTESESVRPVSYSHQAIGIASALAIGGAAWYGVPKVLGSKTAAGFWYNAARTFEEFFPGGHIWSTFRVSEVLSSMISHSKKMLVDVSTLSSGERAATGRYFQSVLNISDDINAFKSFDFIPHGQYSPTGKLIGKYYGGESKVLASNIRLTEHGRMFESYYSVVQPGIASSVSVPRKVMGGAAKSKYVPVLAQGTARDVITGARTYAAFAAQRLGELMETIGSEIKLPGSSTSLHSLLQKAGIGMGQKRGPALRTLLRYSKFATTMGAGFLGLKTLDALRSSTNPVISMIGIGGTASAMGLAGRTIAKRLKKSPRTGMFVGLAASLLQFTPAFRQGLIPGIAGVAPSMNLLRSSIGEITGLNRLRRWTEGTFPASTGIKTSLYMGMLGGLGIYGYAKYKTKDSRLPRLRKDIYPVVRAEQLKVQGGTYSTIDKMLRTEQKLSKVSTVNKTLIQGYLKEMTQDNIPLFRATEAHEAMRLAYGVEGKIKATANVAVTSGKFLSREWQKLLAGARAGKLLSALRPAALLAGLWAIPSLGTLETPEELRKRYSGEDPIAVRRGRAWEMGRSPYQGNDILYHRAHWFARMLAKARVRGDAATMSSIATIEPGSLPITDWILKNFTYAMERDSYDDRPMPITSAAFDQVPFVYPLIRAIGDLIKPPKLMHVDQVARISPAGALELKFNEDAMTPSPSGLLGGLAPGAPVSPYSSSQILRRAFYENTELAGLVGWAAQGIYTGITDANLPFAEDAVLQSTSDIGSMRKAFWAEQMGGAFLGIPLMSESVRRFMPAFPSFINEYNPIRNQIPSWMPQEFHHGDPRTSLRHGLGEERLPGPMFEELYGVKQGKYELPHRLQILADVASYSKEYRDTSRQAMNYMAMNPDAPESAYMNNIMTQLEEKRSKIDFSFYQNRASGYGAYNSAGELEDINDSTRARGFTAATAGRTWEAFIHTIGQVTSPIEHILPAGISPWAKLVSQMDPVEDYEMNQVYGQQHKFWSHPWKNWFRPALSSLRRYWLGDTTVPSHEESTRDIQEYYDKLKWVKYQRLAIAATEAGKASQAESYRQVAKSTRFGANPYDPASTAKYTLPYSDRAYYDTFSLASNDETRSDILARIPHDQRAIYQGRWSSNIREALRRKDVLGTLNSEGIETLRNLEEVAAREGKEFNESLYATYRTRAPRGVSYPDWVRMKEAETYFAARKLPSPDWIGFNPAVDLEDVKLQQIQEEGRDAHDFDIFRSRVSVLPRKPYLDGAYMADTNELQSRMNAFTDPVEMSRLIRRILRSRGITNVDINHTYNSPHRSTNALDLSVGTSNEFDMGSVFG